MGRVAAKPTVGLDVQEALRSCLSSPHRWCANGRSAFQYFNDVHRCTAVPADEDRSGSNLAIVGLGGSMARVSRSRAALRVALAGAGDRQIQLGLNIPAFRCCLDDEARTLRDGQSDGAVAVVHRDLPQRREGSDRDIPIAIFNLMTPGNIRRVVCGEQVGSIVRA